MTSASPSSYPAWRERQVTSAPRGHILTNTAVWSPDSKWVVYDTRPDPAGEKFDGSTIEMANVDTGEVRVLFESRNGARCGVVTHHPSRPEVVFILGPEHPTPDWSYNAYHRQGALVRTDRPGEPTHLDARDLVPPFTPGALRGGSHVHVFSPDGAWVSFTYEDHVLAQFKQATAENDVNQRNVGVSVPIPVQVGQGGQGGRRGQGHPRNRDGAYFSVLVTRTTPSPRPGSDQITKAYEDAWVGSDGYVRADGSRQKRAIAFLGDVLDGAGRPLTEVFIVDLPATAEEMTVPGDRPLQGTATRMPAPPRGCAQRRLTHTAGRTHPGVQGPRHWLRSSPDGARIAFLMRDDAGVVQLWTVSPNGGAPVQVTRNPWPVASAFSWSPDGAELACVIDGSVCTIDTVTGRTMRLTPRAEGTDAPRPEACVFSPDGRRIAYVRHIGEFNQVFVVERASAASR